MTTRTILTLLVFTIFAGPQRAADELEAKFAAPPAEARPWVYWFWMNGNITREGITADLEAMSRVGIGGALMMGVGLRTPAGGVVFNSPEWRALYAHAANEARRLGLQLTLHQCDGWATAGGPWIKPEQSMKMLVWTTREVTGPSRAPIVLDRPKAKENFYEDIAVLAVPMSEPGRLPSPAVTINGQRDTQLSDGNPNTGASSAAGKTRIELRYDSPRTVRTLVFHLPKLKYSMASALPAIVSGSADGKNFEPVAEVDLNVSLLEAGSQTLTVSFPARQAIAVRVDTVGPWPGEIGEIEVRSEPRVHLWEVKAGFAREREHGGETPWLDRAPFSAESLPATVVVARDRVVNLTGKLSANGTLDWQPPAGRWQIIRAGMTSTGKHVAPPTDGGAGLEADKMSGDAIRHHFASFAKGVIAEINRQRGGPIFSVHTDSWESNLHTWSSRFQEEFQGRRGYAMTAYLPVLTTGLVIGSAEESERFLWDVRRTMADLIRDNFYGEMQRLSHESGVLFQSEAAGRQMFLYDPINYKSRADIPVGEFWMPAEVRVDCKVAASVAHTYDRPIAAAESFTEGVGKFADDPFALKAIGDHAFATGINRFIVHRYAMQPWIGVEPGMLFAAYGINFDRNQTWWENGAKAWCSYVGRCQALLQTGRFVADVAVFIGEDAPNFLGHRDEIWDPVPAGYDFDGVNLEILERFKVTANGDLVLPHGMRYRVLLLPNRPHMTPGALETIARLVANGATVIGPRPVRSPSLTNQPASDAAVRKIASELWGAVDGRTRTENRHGKGRVIAGRSLASVLHELAPPDFDYTVSGGNGTLRYIHRRTDDADFYFVANADSSRAADATARFRVTGKAPEFWDPATGAMMRTAVYRQNGGVTEVPLRFDPAGSMFVVFRRPADKAALTSVSRSGGARASDAPLEIVHATDGLLVREGTPGRYTAQTAGGKSVSWTIAAPRTVARLDGPWEIAFPPGKQAPVCVVLPKLISWAESAVDGVKYFSGTATYKITFEVPAPMPVGGRFRLDLGSVKNVAEVTLNGKSLGTLWKPPFRVDATAAARSGTNTLEVRVTNLWPNRLIGDERLHPADARFAARGTPWTAGGPVEAWPDWLAKRQPRTSGRTSFTSWRLYGEDAPLLPSGLLGPVTIEWIPVTPIKL
ncbi:MAG: glycosyl hydrolase [Opitutaceae bacterium]|nr:glycosyl hydrolase [Opitutaceae bacterium]